MFRIFINQFVVANYANYIGYGFLGTVIEHEMAHAWNCYTVTYVRDSWDQTTEKLNQILCIDFGHKIANRLNPWTELRIVSYAIQDGNNFCKLNSETKSPISNEQTYQLIFHLVSLCSILNGCWRLFPVEASGRYVCVIRRDMSEKHDEKTTLVRLGTHELAIS